MADSLGSSHDRMIPKRSRGKRAQAVAWAFLVPVFYLPMAVILGQVVFSTAGRTALQAFLASRTCSNVLSFTLWESFLSALGSILLSLPGAYIFGRFSFRGKRLARGFLILPFVLPSILAVLAMVVAYGRNGMLNQLVQAIWGPAAPRFTGLYSLAGVILTHVFFNFALGIRLIGEAWERLDPRLTEAAESLGAKPFTVWRTVVLPLIWPSVAVAFVLAFVYSSLSFTVVLVFGGLSLRTLEVLIFDRLQQDLDFTGAYAVAFVQTAMTGVVLILRAWAIHWRQRAGAAMIQPGVLPPIPRGWSRPFFVLYGSVLALFALGPLTALLLRAWRGRGAPDGLWTTANFTALVSRSFQTGVGHDLQAVALQTLSLAVAVGLGVVFSAYILAALRGHARAGLMDTAVELPLGASVVTLCLGLLTLYGRFLSPWILVAWGQVVMGVPLGFMTLRAARSEEQFQTVQAAQSLGASPLRALIEVELPQMRRAILTAFAYGAAFSLGDVAAVSTLGQGRVVTISVAIYRLLGHYRYPQALALGSILLLLSLGLFMAIERLGVQTPVRT